MIQAFIRTTKGCNLLIINIGIVADSLLQRKLQQEAEIKAKKTVWKDWINSWLSMPTLYDIGIVFYCRVGGLVLTSTCCFLQIILSFCWGKN